MYQQSQQQSFDRSILELRKRGAGGAQEAVQPKYVDWFEGKPLESPAVIGRIAPPAPTVIDVREVTMAIMTQVGTQTHDVVSSRMPKGSRLLKTIKAKVLEQQPQFGACRVGSVVLGRKSNNEQSVAEFYVTNFDAKLSTSSRQFYTPSANSKGGMFFGVGVITDTDGRVLRFDTSSGVDGLYFQTKDLAKAIYGIASISTGMSIHQLMEIDRTERNSVRLRATG